MEGELGKPYYKTYEGIIAPGVFSEEAVRSALNYQHKAGDLFIVTYPKCGTTWMQHIVMLILRKGKPITDVMDFQTNSPSLEMCGVEALQSMTTAGAIKTHIPFHRMKICPQAKYIYVARNPKDCLVSFYHHTKNVPLFNFDDGAFDDFFELFMEGNVEHGDYFDHLLSGYERRNDPNVYFTTFEALKMNVRDEIMKIAKFIDKKNEEALIENPKILEDIIYYSSFDYMKKRSNDSFGTFMRTISDVVQHGQKIPPGLLEFKKNAHKLNVSGRKRGDFIRKGIVGDWKNYMNDEQVKRLEERIKIKTANSDVMSLWGKIEYV